jgi:hypothetical protein
MRSHEALLTGPFRFLLRLPSSSGIGNDHQGRAGQLQVGLL